MYISLGERPFDNNINQYCVFYISWNKVNGVHEINRTNLTDGQTVTLDRKGCAIYPKQRTPCLAANYEHERVNVADLSVVVVVKYVLQISDSDVFNIRFLV